MGIRATSDFPIPAAQPDLLIAGVYDYKAAAPLGSGIQFVTKEYHQDPEAEIVPFPSPFLFQVKVHNEWLDFSLEIKSHTRTLNLLEGVYLEEYCLEDQLGRRSKIQSLRCASLADPHLLLQRIRIEAENFSSSATIIFSVNLDEFSPLYPNLKEPPLQVNDKSPQTLSYSTKRSQIQCAIASKTFLEKIENGSSIVQLELKLAGVIEIYRIISIFTSKDTNNPLESAKQHILNLSADSFKEKIDEHKILWRKFWLKADLEFKQYPEITQAQRFNIYHLRSAVHPEITKAQRFNMHLRSSANIVNKSIPAKALTGRAYDGHIFWDTEIFMFPFFLYTEPQIARTLLLYRYDTLDGARQRAKELGYAGACYAWESTLSGKDVTPNSILISGTDKEVPVLTGSQQIHVSADVVYAIWKYWDATLDEDFLRNIGAEIMIETARFWSSRVSFSNGSYHILKVIGPDEYHYNVDDNAYTNWMVRFNLEKAVWVCHYIKEKSEDFFNTLASKINLLTDEILAWQHIANSLFIAQPDTNNIIEQFHDFLNLKVVTLDEHGGNRAPVSRLFNWKQINETQLVKQADVLMIPFLFPNSLSREVVTANFDYYEPKTDQGSSLSPCVYAAVAAQIGRFDIAKSYWERSLNLDLDDIMLNTGLGVHPAAMGGAWQALVFHLLGVEFTNKGPKLKRKPNELDALGLGGIAFNLIYRGISYPISIPEGNRP